ncbi:unnamed protein product, partial [Prorocentrum cordatum]
RRGRPSGGEGSAPMGPHGEGPVAPQAGLALAPPGWRAGGEAEAGAGWRAADGRWRALGAAELPPGWATEEAEPEPPGSEACFAALLHGDCDQWLAYACVLGRRLKETSPGPDRAARRAQGLSPARSRSPGPVQISALGTAEFRRASFASGPRVIAAATAHSAGDVLRASARGRRSAKHLVLSTVLGAKVRMPQDRVAQVEAMVQEVQTRDVATYLPEQYYLAERIADWTNLGSAWNWEVWPEWDDPGFLVPRAKALRQAREGGWSGYYVAGSTPSPQAVLQQVRVWHFSGNGVDETAPWWFQD